MSIGVKVNPDKIKKKHTYKYGFADMKVGDALKFYGKNKNQIQAACTTLINYHKKKDGLMALRKFEYFEIEGSTKENPITVIKRIL